MMKAGNGGNEQAGQKACIFHIKIKRRATKRVERVETREVGSWPILLVGRGEKDRCQKLKRTGDPSSRAEEYGEGSETIWRRGMEPAGADSGKILCVVVSPKERTCVETVSGAAHASAEKGRRAGGW